MKLLLAAVLLLQDKSAEQLIEGLRSDKVEERESAARELEKRGSSAVPALCTAAANSDAELSARAKAILAKIDSANAKAAFGKIEEAIQNATTLRIRFKSEGSAHGPNIPESERSVTATGTLLLKIGNKLFQEVQVVNAGKTSHFSIISDGTHVLSRREDRKSGIAETPKTLKSGASIVIARMGAESPFEVEDGKVDLLGLEKETVLTDFREVPGQGGAKALSFKLIEEKVSTIAELQFTLWYEPTSYRLLKRMMAMKFKDVAFESSTVVTYEEFTINADIPDEKFKLPEEKK